MMRVFVDTNVLLDVLDATRPQHESSSTLFRSLEDGRLEWVVTGLTLINTVYILRKHFTTMELSNWMLRLWKVVDLAPMQRAEMVAAMASGWNDLEDAAQFHSAIASGRLDAIVSNDIDFKQQKLIPVLSPQQMVKKLKQR